MSTTVTAPKKRESPDAPTSVEEGETDHRRRRLLAKLGDFPAWLISMLIHVMLLLVLGLITIADPREIVNVLTAVVGIEEGPEIEDFSIDPIDAGALTEVDLESRPVDVSSNIEIAEPTSFEPIDPSIDIQLAESVAPTAPPLQTLSQFGVQSLSSRSGDMKQKLLNDFGGNASSEAAVTEALKWLARHQMPNGAWSFQHNNVCRRKCGDPGNPNRAAALNAATAMALMPFLGAGQTHKQGRYKDVVGRGLRFLVSNGRRGKRDGARVLDLSESFLDIYPGNMYSHALSAIALCEAYAMTKDPELGEPAQNALNFTAYSQSENGGWRYFPKERRGDTSVTGWQVMALKSGHMGQLNVRRSTMAQAMQFLDHVQSENGSQYGYLRPNTEIIPSCTAIGLLCRMYLGWKKTHPGIVRGVQNLTDVGVLKDDLYYDYYAAQVLRHFGGAGWNKFNLELRDWLVEAQSQKGDAKGSWYFPDSRSLAEGGRLANTSVATMILEVYYRHMPLYQEAAAAEDEFPL